MDLTEVIRSLNPDDDSHWTSSHLPRLETLRALTGDESINRQLVEEHAPGLTRQRFAEMFPENDQAPASVDAGPVSDPVSGGDQQPATEPVIEPEVEPTIEPLPQPPAPPAEPAQLIPPEAARPTRDQFEEEIRLETEAVAALQESIAELHRDLAARQARIVKLEHAMLVVYPPESPAEAIRRYQQNNHDQRVNRAARRQALNLLLTQENLGEGSAAIESKVGTSPLDRAMASNTGFGRDRPNIPRSG